MKKEVTIWKSTLWLLIIGYLFSCFGVRAQTTSPEKSDEHGHGGIDSAMAFSPAFMPVNCDNLEPLFLRQLRFSPIDTSIVHIHRAAPLNRIENIYQSLGINGQAHYPIGFDFTREVGFSYMQLPYNLYFKKQSDLLFYDLKSAYTKIAYGYGISTENIFSATHAQKFRGVTAIFNMHGYRNDGYFTHQQNGDLSVDGLLHYEIPSGIYGFRVSYIYNRLKAQENGGLLNVEDFYEHKSENLQGYNMNLYNANSHIATHDLLVQQYVNIKTKGKNKKEKSHYLGTLTHSFQFKHLKINYLDHDLDSAYYRETFLQSADSTADSVLLYNIINTLQWTSYSPFDTVHNSKRYFVHFGAGIRHEYTEDKRDRYFGNTFSLFGETHVRLFSVLDLRARLAYSFADYNNNDVSADLNLVFAISRKNEHYLGFRAHFDRFSPDFFYSHYKGNHSLWDTAWAKQNVLKLSAYWARGGYRATFSYFLLKDWVLLDRTCAPMSVYEFINLYQLHLYAPLRVKGFGFDANIYLQYADSKYVPVPVFAGKANIFYIFNLFKKKLQLQLGFDMMYNTNYHANGYYPVLHQFYYQGEIQKVGNYFYLDAYLNLKVKRFGIFLRVGHFLSGVMGYNYFTTPQYPMQQRNFSLGVNWRFYD